MKTAVAIFATALFLFTAAGVYRLAHAQSQAAPAWRIVKSSPNTNGGDYEMDHIPKSYGRLVSVESKSNFTGAGNSWLWFEADDGTVRLVRVQVSGTISNGVWSMVTEFPRR